MRKARIRIGTQNEYAKNKKHSYHRTRGPRQNNARGQDAVHRQPLPRQRAEG